MAIKISGSTIIDDSRNIVAGVAATFTGNVIVGSGVTINSTGVIATGIVTAASFDGSLATTNLTGTVTNAQLAGSIADSKLNTISTAGKVDLAALEIDGGTDIGAALADADLFIVDDAAGGTNRKTAASRIKTYIADVTLTTAAQTNITSLGTLSAVTVSGDITANGNITGDAATIISGISTVGATTFYGKLNNLTFPSANGSDGQVLTSDGAGVAQWEDASGSVTSDAQRNTLGGTNAGDSFSGTDATDNTLFGYDSGTAITTGDKNTLLGSYAGDSLTSSSNVTAIGYYAASTISTQSAFTGVTAVGSNACKTSVGQRNTVVGFDAFKTGSSGGYNCILGNEAAKSADGSSNIVIGDSAHLYGTSDASHNIVLGRNAFVGSSSNHASSHSISIGYDSMYNGSRTTAYGNIAIGSSTGKTLTTGSNCVIIGNSADASSATVNNEITLGNSDITKFRIPGVNFNLKDTTATEDYVLTVDANGDCGWEAASGITTADVSTSTLYVVGVSTFTGNIDANGNLDVDGTLEADAITVNGTALDTHIAGVTVTTATNATNFACSANNSTDETVYPVFVDGATGNQGGETDTGLTYNPSDGNLTATTFTGALTGNVTGNASGSSGSCTGNAAGLTGTPDITINNITGVAATFTGVLTYEDVTNVDSIGLVTARSGIEFGAAGVGGTIRANGNTTLAGIVTASGFYVGGTQLSGTTISDNANNRIITGSDTANTLRAETSLEWNATNTLTVKHDSSYQDFIVKTNAGGGELELFRCGNGPFRINNDDYSATGGGDELVVGRDSGDRGMTIASGNDSNGSIFFGDDGDGDIGKIQYDHSANAMIFTTNTSERLRITNAGRVGIGTDNPTAPLVVSSSDNNLGILTSTDDGANLDLYDNDTQSRIRTVDGELQLRADVENAVADSAIRFFVDGANEKVRITGAGNVGIGTDNPTHELDIESVSPTIELKDSDNNYTFQLTQSGSATYVDFDTTGGGSSSLRIRNNGDEKLRVSASGMVGIATAAPACSLHVYHATTNEAARFESGDATCYISFRDNASDASVTNRPLLGAKGDVMFFQTNGSERFRIEADGDFRLSSGGSASNYGWIRGWDSSTGNMIIGADQSASGTGDYKSNLIFRSRGSETMRITSAGSVGIGTTNPSNQLHIDGGSADVDVTVKAIASGKDARLNLYSHNTGVCQIRLGDDTDTNIGRITYYHSASGTNEANSLEFITGDASRVRVASTGLVLPQTTNEIRTDSSDGSDNKRIILAGGGDNSQSRGAQIAIYGNEYSSHEGRLQLLAGNSGNANGVIQFHTGGAERARIDSDGRLLIGDAGTATNTPMETFTSAQLQLCTTGGGTIILGRNDTSVAADNYIGGIYWNCNDSTSNAWNETAKISIDADDAHANGDYPSRMTFHTCADGAATVSERLRITSGGLVLVGTTATGFSDGYTNMTLGNTSTTNTGLTIASRASDGYSRIHFADGTSGAARYAGWIAYDQANDAMKFSTANSGSPKLVLDSLGNVLIGTTTEGNSNSQLTIANSGNAGITIRSGTSDWGVLYFSDATSGADEYVGAVQYNHNTNYMMFRTTSEERLRIDAEGNVCINATSTSSSAILLVSGQGTTDLCGNANETHYPIFNDIHFTGSTTLTGNRTKAAIRNDVEYSVTSGTSSTTGDRLSLYGIHSSVNTTKAAYTNVGGYFYVSNAADNVSATQTVQGVYGYGRGYCTDTNNNVNIYGGYFLGYRGGNVSAGHCYGVYARAHNTTNGSSKGGDMTGVYAECEFDEENITNAYAFRGHMDRDAGTITSSYILYGSYSGDASFTNRWGIYIADASKSYIGGNFEIGGTLTKGGGSFRINHPLPALKDKKDLVHSFIEGPQMDLIYRGKVDLVNGTASVNIDTKAGMTEGTFVLLNRDIQCFTSNETGWTAVKGSVTGNIITIVAQDNTCTDTISWMVVGERQDDTVKSLEMTDDNGDLIVEPDRSTHYTDNYKYQAEGEKNIYNEDPNANPNDEM